MEGNMVITTAIELEPQQQAEVVQSLHESFQFSEAIFKVDPQILGGIKLTLSDRIIDCSLARKLRKIRSNLIKR